MTKIVKNVQLTPQGLETSAANSNDVAMYTANYFAAFSTDGGQSFTRISPYGLMSNVGDSFCCDQRVEYVPSIDTFVWILQSGEGRLMLAAASPEEIRQRGTRTLWTYYHLRGVDFGLPDERFDFPQVSFGSHFLYLTFNLVGSGGAIVARYPLSELQQRAVLNGRYIKTLESTVCPCHNTVDEGWFGALISDSAIRVFRWREASPGWVNWFVVNIATVPTTDFSTMTPDNRDWLPPTSKISSHITGAARTQKDMWLAWSAGKKYADGSPSPITQSHVELAVIDMENERLGAQRYIWNRDYAFAWPSLACNYAWENPEDEQVAIALSFGGPSQYPQHVVGILGDPPLYTTTSGRTAGSGGHYNDVRMCYPNTKQFVATGATAPMDNSTPPVITNRVNYVIFER
jgi:hypothetical protein